MVNFEFHTKKTCSNSTTKISPGVVYFKNSWKDFPERKRERLFPSRSWCTGMEEWNDSRSRPKNGAWWGWWKIMVPGGGVILPGMIVEIDVIVFFFGWWGVADGSGKIKPPVVSLLFLVIWFCQFLRWIFGQIGSLKHTSDTSVSPHPSSTFQCRTS